MLNGSYLTIIHKFSSSSENSDYGRFETPCSGDILVGVGQHPHHFRYIYSLCHYRIPLIWKKKKRGQELNLSVRGIRKSLKR